MNKETYTTPSIESLGSFESLTQGNTTGSQLDQVQQSGTSVTDLTFS